jgi:hypothetical protein
MHVTTRAQYAQNRVEIKKSRLAQFSAESMSDCCLTLSRAGQLEEEILLQDNHSSSHPRKLTSKGWIGANSTGTKLLKDQGLGPASACSGLLGTASYKLQNVRNLVNVGNDCYAMSDCDKCRDHHEFAA